MPTSSIFKHFEIPADRAEEFINMLEKSEREQKLNPKKLDSGFTYLTDPEEIHYLLKRAASKNTK